MSSHPLLVRALSSMVVHATLMSEDGTEDRANLRFKKEGVYSVSIQVLRGQESLTIFRWLLCVEDEYGIVRRPTFSPSARAIPIGTTVEAMIGSLTASPQPLSAQQGGPKSNYFVLEHLVSHCHLCSPGGLADHFQVIRPQGRFRIKFTLVTVAGYVAELPQT